MRRTNDSPMRSNDGNGSQKSATGTITKVSKLAASKPAAVKKPAAKKAASPAEPKNPLCYLVVDHPQEGEQVQNCHYAIRIGAGGGHSVELQINGGDWMNCRSNAGYWWFDWYPSGVGTHKIVARMKTDGGAVKKSKVVSVISF